MEMERNELQKHFGLIIKAKRVLSTILAMLVLSKLIGYSILNHLLCAKQTKYNFTVKISFYRNGPWIRP